MPTLTFTLTDDQVIELAQELPSQKTSIIETIADAALGILGKLNP